MKNTKKSMTINVMVSGRAGAGKPAFGAILMQALLSRQSSEWSELRKRIESNGKASGDKGCPQKTEDGHHGK